MNLLGIGDIIGGVGKIADDLVTTDEEKLQIALKERAFDVQEKAIDAEVVKGQLEINKAEAQHSSIFVAGWRPSIGWIGAAALGYQFILYPLMVWVWQIAKANGWIAAEFDPPPVLDTEDLWVILSGMLGIAGLRSFDKTRGTASMGLGVAVTPPRHK